MLNPDIQAIKNLSRAFRDGIEACDKSLLPVSFSKFPRGTCGDATPLLGSFLSDHGFGEFMYMLGGRNGRSHAWLQQGELVVDITGDQFDDQEASVVVAYNSTWHAQFQGKNQHIANIGAFGTESYAGFALKIAYESILSYIQEPFLPPK